jgi:hypothetical protein
MLDTFDACVGNPAPCKEYPPHFCGWVSYSAYDSGTARSCVQMVGSGSACVEDGNCYGGKMCNLYDTSNPSSGICTTTNFPTMAPTIMYPGDDCTPNPAADPCAGDSECRYSAFLGRYRCTATDAPTGVPSQTPTKSPTPTPTMDFGSALIGTDGWGTAISVGTNYAVFGKPGTDAGGDENEVEVWKKGPSGWAYLKTYIQPDNPHAQVVAISPDDKYFAAGSADSRQVTLWEQRANNPDDWGYRGAFDMGGATGTSVALNEHMFLFGDPQNSRVYYKLHDCNKAPGNTDCLGTISVNTGSHAIDPPGTPISSPINNPTMQFGASIETEDGYIIIGAPGANEAHIYSYTNESISYVNTLDAAAVLAEYGDTVSNLGQSVATSGGEAFVATSTGDIYTMACVAPPTASPTVSPTASPSVSPTESPPANFYDFCHVSQEILDLPDCTANIPPSRPCPQYSTCWSDHSLSFKLENVYPGCRLLTRASDDLKYCKPWGAAYEPSPGELYSVCVNDDDCLTARTACQTTAQSNYEDDYPFSFTKRCRPIEREGYF